MVTLKDKYIAYLGKHRQDEISPEVLFLLPYQLLRENYEDKDLRENGVFFSCPAVATQLVSKLGVISSSDNVIDPCCGAGDLLLAYVNKLPQHDKPDKFLDEWSKIIYGNDINADLVDVTNLRLIMAAYFMCGKKYSIGTCLRTWKTFRFPHLSTKDALAVDIDNAGVVLLNPPYQQRQSQKKYSWGSGNISLAAVFLYELYQKNPAAKFAAILPDVIRSGSRYQMLRKELSTFNWNVATIYGRFDKQTDVDVFLISNQYDQTTERECCQDSDTISKYFDVHVGSIVPHRDEEIGQERFYLTAKNTPTGGELIEFHKKIQSKRTPFSGPFLVVKRTSSPSDKRRCAATVINSTERIYVENHLIVLLPKDNSVETCRKALHFFNSADCDRIINARIRCRHLTVASIKDLPYKQEVKNE